MKLKSHSNLRHADEIQQNLQNWQRKPVLRQIYRQFYDLILQNIHNDAQGLVVELGSGIGNLKAVLPTCICTDLFPNPWIDLVENAYALSFQDGSLSDLILFDVYHHLEYPGTALKEFWRVLKPGGRFILFEPCASLLGNIVYGLLHPEPLGWNFPINWIAPIDWPSDNAGYYAAQANASRHFIRHETPPLVGWQVIKVQRLAALSYVASGGYSGPQLYPTSWLPLMRHLDRLCDHLPSLFATRLLVVLEKVF